MGTLYKTVVFYTLSCKLNYAEASTLSRDFINFGYAIVNSQDSVDVYVINACSVTSNADKKYRKIIRQILKRSPLFHLKYVLK